MQHSFFSGVIVAALSLILVSCGGGGAREVAVRQQEEGYYTEVRDDIEPEFLCAAAENGDVREARFLLENGADPNAFCPVNTAAEKAVCATILTGLMITAFHTPLCWSKHAPIHLAAAGGHAEILKLLLENDAHLEPKGGIYDKDTPSVSLAATSGRLEAVRVLLEYGAQPDDASLAAAVNKNETEIVRALLEYGANPDMEIVIKAVQNNNYEIVQLLLDCGANPGAGDIKGVRNAWDFARDNPVIWGILARYLEAVKAGTWEKKCPQKTEI